MQPNHIPIDWWRRKGTSNNYSHRFGDVRGKFKTYTNGIADFAYIAGCIVGGWNRWHLQIDFVAYVSSLKAAIGCIIGYQHCLLFSLRTSCISMIGDVLQNKNVNYFMRKQPIPVTMRSIGCSP